VNLVIIRRNEVHLLQQTLGVQGRFARRDGGNVAGVLEVERVEPVETLDRFGRLDAQRALAVVQDHSLVGARSPRVGGWMLFSER
jgi:hypothetical protein